MNKVQKTVVVAILFIAYHFLVFADEYEYKYEGVPHAGAYLHNKIVISQPDLHYSLFILTSKNVLKEAYTRIGKSVEFEVYPVERSVEVANAGIVNGELARIAGLQNKYPDLIQVPIPVSFNEVFVYSKKYDFKVDGWQSLKPYKFDFVFGFKFVEQKSKGLDTEKVKTEYQGLRKLEAGRSDLFIGGLGIQCLINKYNYKFTDIKRLKPKLDDLIMYHYLHKNHEDIAKKLEAELKKMQSNGEIALIQKQAELVYLDLCK